MILIEGTTIKIIRGDTARIQIEILDAHGDPYVLAEGDSVRFAMKKNYYQPNPDLLKTIPNDTLILQFNPEDTKPFAFGQYKYDIELTTASGDVDTFIDRADFYILEEVH